MKNQLIKISFIFLFTFLFYSCQDDVYYIKSFSFSNNAWKIKNKPVFKIDVNDINRLYDINISIRTTNEYKYSNCWIYINSISPDKKKSKEAFEIKFANDDGTWIGKKTGSIVEHKISFKNKKFPLKGKYKFIIEQAVIQNQLNDILDLTFEVKFSKNK